VVLLWHKQEPIGICVFSSPAAAQSLRTNAFGLVNPRSSVALSALNEQLWLLSRVVLHPTYRGAGIASQFVRRACETCRVRWIETLTALGHINPFFEKAGFRKIGMIRFNGPRQRNTYSKIYGRRNARVTQETFNKSRFSQPVYYVFENRAGCDVVRES